jgi:hypothetical protein
MALDVILSELRLILAAIGNWVVLYNHQVKLISRHFTIDPAIRDRALQCLIPPTLLFLLSFLSLALVVSHPRMVTWPAKKVIPALPWTVSAGAIAVFAIIARPALWEHRCDSSPIRINPSDRSQWQDVWISMNRQRSKEPDWKYRTRMDSELDEWSERERKSGDLEDWVNLSAEAATKRDCLNQKDELFRATWAEKKSHWLWVAGEWWRTSQLRQWLMASTFQAAVCQPETRISRWAAMMKRARELGLQS